MEAVSRDVLYHGIVPYLGPRHYFMMQHVCKNFPVIPKSKSSIVGGNMHYSNLHKGVVSFGPQDTAATVYYWLSSLQNELIRLLESCGFGVYVYTEHFHDQVRNKATHQLEIHAESSQIGIEVAYQWPHDWLKYTSPDTTSLMADWCRLGYNKNIAFCKVATPSKNSPGFKWESRRAFSAQQGNLLKYVLSHKREEKEKAQRHRMIEETQETEGIGEG
jgi:hypothetical protein